MHNKTSNEVPRIDIDATFKSKNEKLYKLIPGFLLRYIKRVVHQDEINELLVRYKELEGVDVIDECLNNEFRISRKLVGSEFLDPEKKYLFAGNHPLGAMDGIVFISLVGHFFGKDKVKAVVTDLLLHLPNLRKVFIGVNHYGRNSKETLTQLDQAFGSDQNILFFPAGFVSRKIKGKVQDVEWKKTFLTRAKRHQLDVVPVHISGKNSNFFYNLARLRKALGIKLNLELIYLADELFRQKDNELVVTLGKPVPYAFFDKSKKPDEWAALFRAYVYSLPEGESRSFVEIHGR